MSMEWGFHVEADGTVRGIAVDAKPVRATEAELRQWWRTLGLALQRQSAPRLDALGMSAGKVRDVLEQSLRERSGWERWELFIEAVFGVGEDVFVKLVGANCDG